MKFYEFEHDFFPHILIPLLGGLFVIAALHSAARAETSAPTAFGHNSFIISADDGYGVKDCIRGGDDCAKIVADAWCEAHGHGSAQAFGRAGDITATIEKSAVTSSPSRKTKDDDVFISCGE
ncbi:hypothetical protein [Rhodoblastus sp.]|jgi:hypothetical protein|uniref:hypothetical protein n=1 Tax=Rhodoblastus sp. TaxID=1962975 RepID=UPI0025D8A72E|nr:hypothetical protein [Rhodoblastus sp.]